ncbi:MAG: IS21-like element helper ATPase IstB [Acidimicrobiales bacterium]|jgi:DNA replication protein DnaC
MTPPPPAITPELRALLRRLRLGQVMDTLPERAALAKSSSLSHLDFLAMVLADEATRRDRTSAWVRARAAHLDPKMTLERWDATAAVTYDRAVLDELVTLRFVEDAHNAFILGPVGVGKTFLATALGHIACRRRVRAHFERADRLFKRLKAARLDASYDAEVRKLIGAELVIIDDFALQAMDATETADFYALVVERHHSAATVLTSNRDPSEWLTVMADPMLAQSAIDRLQSAAFELVIEGESYRRREKPTVGTKH